MKGKMKVATAEAKKVNRKRQIKSEKSNGKHSFISTIFASFKNADASIVDIAPYKSLEQKTGTLVDHRNNLQVYLKVKLQTYFL